MECGLALNQDKLFFRSCETIITVLSCLEHENHLSIPTGIESRYVKFRSFGQALNPTVKNSFSDRGI